MAKSAQIALHAQIGELPRLQSWLEALCEPYQLSERVSFQLDLCLAELVTNVINYAYPAMQPPDEAIVVRLLREADRVVLELIDWGVEFDPVRYVPAAPSQTLEEVQIGGRGLLLVRKFAAQLDYRREDGCNRLTLVFPAP